MKINLVILFFLFFTGCSVEQNMIDIYTIGDSTMANKTEDVFPETGWGQVLDQFFTRQVRIHNHAVNGRSTKSFIDQGRWQLVMDSLKKGDYVFIQFGHNDEKINDSTRYTEPFGDYSRNLALFVRESREKGAVPVLFTPIVRRRFNVKGELVDTHHDYPVAVRKLSNEMDVPLVDLEELTKNLVQSLGEEKSKEFYLWTQPNEHFPEGRQDNTHLCTEGAMGVASLAVQRLKELPLNLDQYILKQKKRP